MFLVYYCIIENGRLVYITMGCLNIIVCLIIL